MEQVRNMDELHDAVFAISQEQASWNRTHFTKRIFKLILHGLEEKDTVESNVYIAWFHMCYLLPKTASRERVRATFLGIKDWLKN